MKGASHNNLTQNRWQRTDRIFLETYPFKAEETCTQPRSKDEHKMKNSENKTRTAFILTPK